MFPEGLVRYHFTGISAVNRKKKSPAFRLVGKMDGLTGTFNKELALSRHSKYLRKETESMFLSLNLHSSNSVTKICLI